MYMPVWLFMFGCMAFELSTHHCGLSSGSIIIMLSLVSLIHFITLVSFCSRPCLGLFPYFIKMLHQFGCLVMLFCINIVVGIWHGGIVMPSLHVFSFATSLTLNKWMAEGALAVASLSCVGVALTMFCSSCCIANWDVIVSVVTLMLSIVIG